MKLTRTDIKKFQALYVKYFQIALSDENAIERLSALVRQMEIVYQPITLKQFDDLLTKNVNEDVTNEQARPTSSC